MKRFLLWGIVLVFAGTLACSQQATHSERYTQGKDFYYANQLDSAYSAFKEAFQLDPRNSECCAYLAETARRLKRPEEAVYHAARTLELDHCNAFAHTVLAETFNPMFGESALTNFDSVWVHARRAVTCDSTDGNAWLVVWTETIRRGDTESAEAAMIALNRISFFSDAVIEYNRWVLEGLPPDAILLTNGDLDTYPAVMLQSAREFRPDVAIVNLSLLNTDWYEDYLAARYSLPLPLSDSLLATIKPFKTMEGEVETVACQKVEGWTAQIKAGALGRPVTAALTVYSSNLSSSCRNHLRMMGAHLQYVEAMTAPEVDWDAAASAFDRAQLDVYRGNFAGATDRSPIRSLSAKFPVMNLCALGADISRHHHEAGDNESAVRYLKASRELAAANGQLEHFESKFQELDKLLAN